ncbi:unnamed protein product [Rotaria sp. Silwood2]|nr:unnamed protein product [Rotaria sp. Silwood2]CAF2968408.1 unnamed protein product [Rotaria sp. Silwood2]CAF3375976.1 unnamed protein product [Rotaria sp. Silwood2]CAF4167574.1 unnamed protein product [Rotaria sp. Silwood2]CAF4264759.1 unnamed protein product [Rotaria sp. Silwood2]
MHSESSAIKRNSSISKQDNDNSILKYFKKRKNDEVLTTTNSILSVASASPNLQINVLNNETTNTNSILSVIPDSSSSIMPNNILEDTESIREPARTTRAVTCDSNDNSDLYETGIKLRMIETLLHSCQDLIKLSTSVDVCEEMFIEKSNAFADKVLQLGNDLKNLCINIMSKIEANRNKIKISDSLENNLINRDPGPGGEKRTDAWISNGVSTWNKMKSQGMQKKGKLEQHFSSAAHRASVDRYLNFKTKKLNVDLMLNSNRFKENQEQEIILQLNKQVVVTLLDSARYLARQGLAFRREPASEGL